MTLYVFKKSAVLRDNKTGAIVPGEREIWVRHDGKVTSDITRPLSGKERPRYTDVTPHYANPIPPPAFS